MKKLTKSILQKVKLKENELFATIDDNFIEKSQQMTYYLISLLRELKTEVLLNDFKNQKEEITFFKEIKPQIAGKILFYRQVIEMEITSPKINTAKKVNFYKKQLVKVQKKMNDNELNKYILLQRKDKDSMYFLRKNISNFDFQKDFFLK